MFACFAAAFLCASPALDPRLDSSRREDKAGWVYVKVAGSPEQMGFQHGYWLAAEIDDAIKVNKVFEAHGQPGDPELRYRTDRRESMQLFWPNIPEEYKQELQGITEGVRAKGFAYGLEDIVLNAGITDFQYYRDWLKNKKGEKVSHAPEHCSALVATGRATKDGKIVMAHTCWTDYAEGERNNIIFDMRPANGQRILMDSMPGRIDSGDDFAINAAGIMLTETTVSKYVGFDPAGVPEFVRMREAIQYGKNLSDVERWFTERNNGAYANMWLIGDRKTNEIASLELGLKNVIFHRSNDGVITSCNCPIDPKLTAEECLGDVKASTNASSDRSVRWDFLMKRDFGKIDAELGKAYMSDHYDQLLKKDEPSISGLCGHGDVDARKSHMEDSPYDPQGSVQGKVVTSDLCGKMTFWARMGHPCGGAFYAKPFLAVHKQFAWQESVLKDMPSEPWVTFRAGK